MITIDRENKTGKNDTTIFIEAQMTVNMLQYFDHPL